MELSYNSGAAWALDLHGGGTEEGFWDREGKPGRTRQYPDSFAAWEAWLIERGIAPVQIPPIPSLTDRLVDRDAKVREEAAEALHATKDPAHLLALALWEKLHTELCRRAGTMVIVISWDKNWKGTIPEELFFGSGRGKLVSWIEENAERLPPQSLPPMISEVRTLGATKVAERFEPLRVVFTPEELALLDAEEATVLGTQASAIG